MQYGPPSLFKQGTPARVKVIIFVVAAIVLLFVDAHLQMLGKVRHVIGMVIYPVQRAYSRLDRSVKLKVRYALLREQQCFARHTCARKHFGTVIDADHRIS